MSASRLTSEIVLNLSGNMAAKAKSYGVAVEQLGQKNQRAMAMIQNSTAMASNAIDTWGNRAVLGGTVAAVAFERTFVQTAAQFERYRTMLNQLQGSEAEGAKALGWIEQFTQDTPFAVNEVTDAFVKMKAFGIDPMDGSMQAIVDQAAMMGGTAETVDGIALALGQAWTKGKLQGEEALQLLERGVPVWDYLVKASKDLGQNEGLGFTTEQLQDMASKGLLTRDAIRALIDEMGRAAEGSAAAQMEGWDGMVSNMGDHWKLFQKDVMDTGAFDVLKGELDGLLSKLNEMKETGEYQELVDSVGENLVSAFETAADAIKSAKDVGAELLPVLKSIGEGATAISELVGGYGNLAKILASIYVINKASRFLAPTAKGAWTIGKGGYDFLRNRRKGKNKDKDATIPGMPDMGMGVGVQPVFVTNFGDFGGMGGGKNKGKTKTRGGKVTPHPATFTKPGVTATKPASTISKVAAKGASVLPALKMAGRLGARLIPGLGWAMMAYDIGSMAYDGYQQYANLRQNKAGDPVKAAFDKTKPPAGPSYLTGNAPAAAMGGSYAAALNGKIQIEVNDERVKVKTAKVDQPGMQLSHVHGLSMYN